VVFPDVASWGRSHRPWRVAAVVGVLLGFPFGFAVRIVVGAAWATCGIGSEASSGTPLPLLLLTLGSTLLAFAVVTVTLAVTGPRHPVLGATVVMVALLLLLWLVMAVVATPAGQPDPVCHPGNVPYWFPDWLPV
jgi:hypothetical protein